MPGKITASGGFKGNATGLGAKDFVDAHVAGTPLWLLGLHSDGKLRPFNKEDIQAGYADSAHAASTFPSIKVDRSYTRYIKFPDGGTYIAIAQFANSYSVGMWPAQAGGTTVDAGNAVQITYFLPVA